MHDVVVVGAGPAGSAAALAVLGARPDASVLIVDRAAFPRDKACGDGVAPHAVAVLAALGVAPAAVTAGSAPVRALRLEAGDAAVARSMAEPAHVVPRRVLDDRLRAAALSAGALPVEHRVRRVAVRPDGVVLDGELAGRVVVAADGVHSAVRAALGVPGQRPGHTAVALRGYARVRPDLAAEQRIAFARSGWPAYAWSFPVGDGTANVGYGEVLRGRPLTREHLLERLDALLPGAGEGAGSLRAAHLPLSSSRPRQPDGRVLLAGDAASLVNPLTGEGIYYAVASGALAGAAAAASLGGSGGGQEPDLRTPDPGAAYRRALAGVLGTHLRHTRATAALARSHRVVAAGVAAAARDQRVFDGLVELGLGRGLLPARAALRLARALATG